MDTGEEGFPGLSMGRTSLPMERARKGETSLDDPGDDDFLFAPLGGEQEVEEENGDWQEGAQSEPDPDDGLLVFQGEPEEVEETREEEGEDADDDPSIAPPPATWTMPGRPRGGGRGRRMVKAEQASSRGKGGRKRTFSPEQRLLLLETWQRSGLTASDFADLVDVSKHSLYVWKKRFDAEGPAGLQDKPKGGPRGSRLPDATKRAIRLMKEAHPDWGIERISDVLSRTEGFAASPSAIQRVLVEAGYVVEATPTRPHPDKKRRFERAKPNQLWQTDLFTFTLKRENRRVHLVAYMDDHSRFIVGFGLHASANSAMVREVLESAIANFGAPQEVLTDNGPQYVTWRGTSAFTKLLRRRGIRHVVSKPKRPQTLGKVERFWGTLWRECLEAAIFRGIDDARTRIAHFVDHYNFMRPHQGIDGLVPADRFFEAPQVRQTLADRVKANALDLARHGEPQQSLYLTGRIGETPVALHSEGGRVILSTADGERREVDLGQMENGSHDEEPPPPPGASPLDDVPRQLSESAASEDTQGSAQEGGETRDD